MSDKRADALRRELQAYRRARAWLRERGRRVRGLSKRIEMLEAEMRNLTTREKSDGRDDE
jgi:DNA repair ATPase RecN